MNFKNTYIFFIHLENFSKNEENNLSMKVIISLRIKTNASKLTVVY